MTRIELSDASKRVKASLDTVAGDLALFHSEIRQRLTDVIATVTDEYRNALTTFTGDVSNATHKLLSGTEEVQQGVIARASNITEKLDGAAESARASIERLRAVEPPPLLLAKRLNKVCESLEGLGAPIQALTERFQQTEQATAEAIRTIATASQQLVEITRESREHNTTILRHIADAAQSFQGSLAAAGVALQNDRTVLQQLQVDVRKSADESHRAREAANATLQTFTDVAKDVATIIRAAGPRDPGSHT
jgi:chromosome segregation ATPase